MFNVEFLHIIREYELQQILQHIPQHARVLEIGGGTGYQARRLAENGINVKSIDLPDGTYSEENQEFEVIPYDGVTFPFPDESFDVVFSSNVLEHISDLEAVHLESRRVLKPEGFCLHVMPSGAWRFWTNIAHYTEMVQRCILELRHLRPVRFNAQGKERLNYVVSSIKGLLKFYKVVPRHGEQGNAFSEIYFFSRFYWNKHFRKHHFEIMYREGNRIHYTGHMILGKRCSTKFRRFISVIMGSSCNIYKLDPPGGIK